MVNGLTNTPRYVLNDGLLRIGPVLQDVQGTCPRVIFGFADKPEYDAFKSSADAALTPYPLVKTFFEAQLESGDDTLKLVAIDAASPHEKILYAATFASILQALRNDTGFVRITHRLLLDDLTSEYRIETIPETENGLTAISMSLAGVQS